MSLYCDQQRSLEATVLACQMMSTGDLVGLEKVLTNNSFSQSELTLLKQQIADIIAPKNSNKTWHKKWQKRWNTASPTVMLLGTLIALFIIQDIQTTVGEAQNLTTLQLGCTNYYNEETEFTDQELRIIQGHTLGRVEKRKAFEKNILDLDASHYNKQKIQEFVSNYQLHRSNILLEAQQSSMLAKILIKHFDVFTGNVTDVLAAKASHRLDGMNGALNALSLCLKAKLVFDFANIWVQIKNYRTQQMRTAKLQAAQELIDKKLAEID